jgi:AraC-like DNA-binding protein
MDVTPSASALQSYRERLPAPKVADEVACAWVQDVAADGIAYEHRRVPNGCVEISHTLGTDIVAVSGPQRRPIVAELKPGTTIVGLRFKPGVAPAVLGAHASELVDLQIGIDRLWGRGGAYLAERLVEASSPEAAARLLEHEIGHRSTGIRGADPLVSAAIDRLQPWRRDDIGTWTAGLFISQRQLRRRFVAALGYGPKTLQRILRFQGFLALSQFQHRRRGTLARLAKNAGYADQAHLTRECSRLAGLPPGAFLEEMWKSCGPSHDHAASYAGIRRSLLAATAH